LLDFLHKVCALLASFVISAQAEIQKKLTMIAFFAGIYHLVAGMAVKMTA
jgi:hypothetical protein